MTDLSSDTIGIRKRDIRPKNAIDSQGTYQSMYKQALYFVNKFKPYSGVIGITLVGGVSRHYADELSELDLNIYLDKKTYNDWIVGLGPYPQGDCLIEGQHVDFSYLNYLEERNKQWSTIRKWDASYAKILYDPTNKIETLLTKKDRFTTEEKNNIALKHYLGCVYRGDIVVKQWIRRRDFLAAHQHLNQTIESLIQLVFLANDEYPPFQKWALNYSYSLPWTPKNWKSRMKKLFIVKTATEADVKRRHQVMVSLYEEIWKQIVGNKLGTVGLLEIKPLEMLEYLVANSPISIEKFKTSYNSKNLSLEPLYKLTRVDDTGQGKTITFLRDKFLDEKDKGFPSFLDWNKNMLKHLKVPPVQ